MRVLGEQAVADPTAIEAQVRSEMAERQQARPRSAPARIPLPATGVTCTGDSSPGKRQSAAACDRPATLLCCACRRRQSHVFPFCSGAAKVPGQAERLTRLLSSHPGRPAHAAARRAPGARRPQPGAHADAGGAQGEEDAQAGRRGGRGRGLPSDVLPHRLAGQHAAPLQSPRECRCALARPLRAGPVAPPLQLSFRALRCVVAFWSPSGGKLRPGHGRGYASCRLVSGLQGAGRKGAPHHGESGRGCSPAHALQHAAPWPWPRALQALTVL